ncbi:phage tail fiber protein [Burkholderia phage Bcep22]|uniref:Phage tail fiber protein n=1 Tax=Burkholderia phage Bcep22 TaxID=2883944 RepID=Q6V7M7_9CAUD|nr:tail fiber protein [Burkholderia phage Bcep22]AAQ54999.1 phage tail fiber protein [Burkholderia phage Bcep22]
MALRLSNNGVGFLAAALAADGTAISLQPGEGEMFPILAAGDWCPGTLVNAAGHVEIVRVTARSDDTFTVQRAQEGTAAIACAPGDRFEHRMTAGTLMTMFNNLTAAITQIRPRVGDIKVWRGAIADIPTVHGPGWQLADGTNGTADLRDRFIVGAGTSYAPTNTGGAATVTLTAAQMPAHNHTVTDPGHTHTVTDPTHAHSVYDPGHAHNTYSNYYNLGAQGSGTVTPYNGVGQVVSGGAVIAAGTGIGIYAAATGISIQSRTTGITTQNAGTGAAHENRPPYYALAFIEYTGIGVTDPL